MDSINSETINNNRINLPGFGHALILIVIAGLISVIIGPIVQMAGKLIPFINEWAIFFSYTISFGVVLIIAQKWWSVSSFDTKGVNFTVYLLLLPVIIAMAIIMEAVVSLIPMPDFVRAIFEEMVQLNWAGYLTLGIAAPILEELIFRGVILKKFLEKYNPTKAIILSSVIFGIAHLNPWQFVAAFSNGIAIGWIYWKTKSIWPGIFIHFINNSFSFYLAKKYEDISITFYDVIGNLSYYISLLVICVLVCYAIYLILDNYFKAQKRNITL
jgi:membrane protease YdiL (CAAX protease family)